MRPALYVLVILAVTLLGSFIVPENEKQDGDTQPPQVSNDSARSEAPDYFDSNNSSSTVTTSTIKGAIKESEELWHKTRVIIFAFLKMILEKLDGWFEKITGVTATQMFGGFWKLILWFVNIVLGIFRMFLDLVKDWLP